MKKIAVTLLLLASLCSYAQVVINEYSAANRDILTDNYGNDADWFELFNAGGATVNLTGYFLTDNPDNLDKWEIPAGVTINAGQTIQIWASGRGESDGVNHHADFKLTQMRQEYIILSDPGLTILDQIWIENPNLLGHSTGRLTDGGAVWGVFENPTPGTSNAGGATDYAPRPTFNVQAGFYGGAQNVSISTDAGFEIRYTTDGSAPTNTSTLYTGPVNVAATTTIRARSIPTGGGNFLDGFTVSNTYFINGGHSFSTFSVCGDLDLWTNGGFFGPSPIVSVEWFDDNGVRQWSLEGELRRHGNDSWNYDQRGMRLHVHDEYGYANKIDYQMFSVKDRTDFDVLIIKAAGSDNYNDGPATAAHMRDGWVQSVSHFADLEVDERTYEHCINYLNGQYWGVYEYRERIDKDFTQEYYNTGGNEMDMLEQWGGVDVEYGTLDNWEDTYDYITGNDMTIQANYDGALQLINKESFIDYMILNTFFVNSDWLNWNTKWWQGLDPDNPMPWRYALWDMDNISGLGQNFTGWSSTGPDSPTVCEISSVFGNGPSWDEDVGHSEIYRNLLENESFFADYINRYTDLLNGALSCDNLTAMLDQFEADMLPEMPAQVDRWGGSVAAWQANVNSIREFNCERYDFVFDIIPDCFPELDGPYDVTVQVNGGVGEVLFSTTTVTDIFEGTYFGGINIDLEAIEVCGSTFTGWTVVSGSIVLADPMSLIQQIELTDDLVIEANFIPNNDPIDIYFETDPPGFGGIMVNGTEITTPGTYSYPPNTLLELTAIESGFEIFDEWELQENEIIGDDDDVTISINTCENGTVIAEFDVFLSEPLTYLVEPAGSGLITSIGTEIMTYPTTENVGVGINVGVVATPVNAGWRFVEWTLPNHTINPDATTSNANFDFNALDTLTARFEEVPTFTVDIVLQDEDGGRVTIDGIEYGNNDQVIVEENGTITINVTANEWYIFDHWETSAGIIIDGNDTDAILDFIINGDGTITGIFTYIEHWDISIDVFPVGSGTITIDGTGLVSYPQIEAYEINENINLVATPIDQWWVFSYWEIGGHTFTPDDLSAAVAASIQTGDDIVAHFSEIINYEIVVRVEPREAGIVTFDPNLNTSSEWSGRLQGAVTNHFIVTENPFHKFIGWRSINNSAVPSHLDKDITYTFHNTDTITALFERIDFTMFIPNSFSPNQDGLNEQWLPNITAVDEGDYKCMIFNRDGEIIFETRDPTKGWDGSHNGGDHYVPDGVYNYVIDTKSYHNLDRIEESGHILVVR